MGSVCLQRLCILGLLHVVLVLSLKHGCFAQGSNCGVDILMPLLPCVPFVEAGNSSAPTSDCCTPLHSLLASANASCLCQIPPLAQQLGITVNQTRALQVVSLCKETIPPSVLSCLSSQATSPLGAPPSSTPTSPPSVASNSSTSTPPPQNGNDNSSIGSRLSSPCSLLLIGSIFVALFLHLGGSSIPS